MKKDKVVRQVAEALENDGYSLVLIQNMHTCMDILAKKLGRKYIIKVVYNIDSATRKEADALSKIASFTDAEPIIVGSVSKGTPLSDGVDYSRFSVRCIALSSLEDLTSDVPTLTASKSVGMKVSVDGARLHYLRKLNNLTRSTLSKSAKVSEDTIYSHEKSSGFASVETVRRIEAVLHGSIKADQRTPPQGKKLGTSKLANTGMRAVRLENAPFDIIAKSTNYYEISGDANIRTMVKRAEVFKAIREAFSDNYPFFVSGMRSGKFHEVPVLSKKQLKKMRSEHDLLEELTY